MGNKLLTIIVVAAGILGGWIVLFGAPFGIGVDDTTTPPSSESQRPAVVIGTDRGDVRIRLFPDAAPKTVENFLTLARSGFYDGTTFHRVVPEFVVQGGDPLSKDDDPSNDGSGGPGYVFEDEINPRSLGVPENVIAAYEEMGYVYDDTLQSYPVDEGYVAMANRGPNTNGSQFFIVLRGQQRHLYGRHTVFGQVVDGMDVVRAIEQGDVMTVRIVE